MRKPEHLSLIALYGSAGAGKSTLADLLHDELGYTAYIGADHIKRFISGFREVSSHLEVTRKVINVMAAEYLKNGINVIVEQGMSRADLENLEEIAKAHNAKLLAYRLDLSRVVANDRAQLRQAALQKPSIPDEELEGHHLMHENNDYPDAVVLESGILSARAMADRVLEDLRLS